MCNPFYSEAYALRRWRKGPLARHLDGFAASLLARGYCRAYGQECMRRAGHLSMWLHRRGGRLEDLSDELVRRHIRSWKRRTGTTVSEDRYELLLAYLRNQGIIRPRTPDKLSEIDHVVNEFVQYLRRERGLAEETIVYFRLLARRFLAERFGSGRVRLSTLTARDLTRYVLRHAQDNSIGYREQMVGVLRSLCRFLRLRGYVLEDLAASVPRAPGWRLTSLPGYLRPDEVKRLLGRCDLRTAKGTRDRAVLMLLVRLGLRAGEVRKLTLDDIDWEDSEIAVCGKGGKRNRLPLPCEVGEALVQYLKKVRPRCQARQVFIRLRAPHTGFACSAAIGRIVKTALQRAGLRPPHMGSHLLRHTFATSMLHRGASLQEIARILRHEDMDSTALYAKVDLGELRTVAQRWPGGAL